MKKLALFLALVMLFTFTGSALAANDFDLSYVRENSQQFTIDVDVENNVAFVETVMTSKDRSFVHKYESSTRYSTTQFDMLVLDYLDSDAYPVLRLWITYCSDESYLNITSATFTLGDKKYTFSEIADSQWYTKDENGYVEKVLIRFNMENVDFLVAMEQIMPDDFADLETLKIPLTLHGRENITVELDYGFTVDFLLMKKAFIECNGIYYLEKAFGAPMKVTDVTVAQ